MILALNLNVLMKRLVLGGSWTNRRMKALRFAFINLPGRVIEHARQLVVRLSGQHPGSELPLQARGRLLELGLPPPAG